MVVQFRAECDELAAYACWVCKPWKFATLFSIACGARDMCGGVAIGPGGLEALRWKESSLKIENSLMIERLYVAMEIDHVVSKSTFASSSTIHNFLLLLQPASFSPPCRPILIVADVKL